MKFEKTKEVLNQLVADLSQMSMVIHQTHWYMRGENNRKFHFWYNYWLIFSCRLCSHSLK